ncbi:hypothetical protein DFP72DRAFT_1133992 [Ephemerocybe angulata]|uniref:Uncharacterized protein n=1 Tax=Ephemerocybe angulata TaxID=980116 RepID=A0A8H6M5K5_9AGAR|nr:hypothetical protein DFP72DRAFT_1133992 [Tulosesus angulatus]
MFTAMSRIERIGKPSSSCSSSSNICSNSSSMTSSVVSWKPLSSGMLDKSSSDVGRPIGGVSSGERGGGSGAAAPAESVSAGGSSLNVSWGEASWVAGVSFRRDSFVQTGGCRRGVLTQVFRNEVPGESRVLCCDNCSPELLDRTRPAPPQTDKRSSNPKRGVPNEDVMEALHLWRVEIAKRDHSKALISGLGLLSDDLVELLSSLGPIATEAALVKLVGAKWVWLGKYKTELFNKLTSLSIPPMIRKPRQTPATKRTIAEVETGDGDGDEEAARRTRTATVQSTTASQAVEPGPVHVGNVAAMPQAIEIAQSHPPPASHIPHAGATFVQAYGQQSYAPAAVHQVSQEQINAQWAQYYAEQRAWAAHYEHVRQMQAQAAAEAARQSEQTQPGVNNYQHPGTLGPAQQTPIPTQASQMVTFRVQEYQHGTVAPAPHRTAPPSAPRR